MCIGCGYRYHLQYGHLQCGHLQYQSKSGQWLVVRDRCSAKNLRKAFFSIMFIDVIDQTFDTDNNAVNLAASLLSLSKKGLWIWSVLNRY